MNILQINATAKTTNSSSTRVADAIVARLKALHPEADVHVRNLATDPVTPLDELAVQARFLQNDARSPEQAARMRLDDEVVEQFLAADIVVLGVPMYNFNIPARLQHWIDAVVRPGSTFRYTDKGPIGLAGGKTVYLGLTSGGFHQGTPADIPANYIRFIMGFLGITDVRAVYAEGMTRGPEMIERGLQSANEQTLALVA